MDERYERAKKLFLEVCDLTPAEAAKILDRACGGDAALRAEVESLLAHRDAPTAPLPDATVPLVAGDGGGSMRIGAYRVIREIGRGGMGVVYLGVRQDDQFNRRVAIKVLKRGMDSDEILRRFRLERQLLAAMNHPGIARLFDGGETEEGLPYFVMEYIEGRPIDEYCDTHRLRIAERLDLFGEVCAAVHYAHQNLVVHRDLKPSNIIVTADGVPRLLDFGIAKLINPEISVVAVDPTAPELRIMTPEYASPEQVRGDPISTASDIYSLGVLLYELVTGHRPYRLRSRIKAEIEHVICEVDPEKPSTAISRVEEIEAGESDTGTASTITPELVSRVREGRPDRLRRRLAGDIDNIVLMAMRKEPQRRYQSAEQFSEDIRRHLDGMPVIARHDTFRYRCTKFVRRHRAGVGAAAVIAILLVGGIVGTASGWQAERTQRELTEQQRDRAESMFNQVRAIARTFMFDFHDEIEALDGSVPARELLVTTALEYLDGLAREVGDDPGLQRELATGYDRVGDIRGGIRNPSLGDKAGALANYRKGLEIRQDLHAIMPGDLDLRKDVSTSHLHIGDVLAYSGDVAGAQQSYHQSLEIAEGLAREDPDRFLRTLSLRTLSIGDAVDALGRSREAMDYYRRALELRERLARDQPDNDRFQRDLAVALNRVAQMHAVFGEFDAALDHYGRSIAVRQVIARRNPDNARFRRDLAVSHYFTGELLVSLGRPAEAQEHVEHMLQVSEQGVHDNPLDARSKLGLAVAVELDGRLKIEQGLVERGHEQFHRFHALIQALAEADPVDTQYRRRLGDSHWRLGQALALTGGELRAATHFARAIEVARGMCADDPDDVLNKAVLAERLADAGWLFLQAGDLDEAQRTLEESRALLETLLEGDPDAAHNHVVLARVLHGRSRVMGRRGYLEQAAADLERALELIEGLVSPRLDRLRRELREDLDGVGAG